MCTVAAGDGGGNLSLKRVLTSLILFGIAFGYVEAAVVVYLRTIADPIRAEVHPDKPAGELLPLITFEQLQRSGPQTVRCLKTELGRELATLVMLCGVALAYARNFRQWFAGFVIAFGVWDVFYYVFLKLLIDWPASMLTWDILFLLPVPWVGPVISPVLVAIAMVLTGVMVLHAESIGRPVRLGWLHWAIIALGGLLIVLAFCWECGETMAGRHPAGFNWPLYGIGGAVGLIGFLAGYRAGVARGDS